MQTDDIYDVTIIGGGPAGMYAAFYAGMRAMKVKLIEGKSELGGFLHMYAEKIIWDVGGIPPMRCDRLIAWLAQQAQTFEPTLVFNEIVDSFQRGADGVFALQTSSGRLHYSRTIVIAAGRGLAEPHKLEIEGASRFELSNVHYTVQGLEHFRGKHVLISGGGNSAVDWALELAAVAGKVTVVHRSDEFRAMERNVAAMKQAADVRTPYAIAKLHGSGGVLERAALEHVVDGTTEELDVDEVVVSHGYRSNYGGLTEMGLRMADGALAVSERAETSVPGVFGAGDCVAYGSKVRLIAGAFADAALAVNSAKLYLEPDAPGMAYVSSHNYIFRERNTRLAH